MKKSTLLVLTLFSMATLHSQTYEIDFAATGASTSVDSVRVENLNQGTSIVINGNDVLALVIPTAIQLDETEPDLLKIYPNPMLDQAQIQFPVIRDRSINLAVIDVSGRMVIQSTDWLQTGVHTYRVSGLNRGLYFVRVSGEDTYYSDILVSYCEPSMNIELKHINQQNLSLNTTKPLQLKSTASTVELPYIAGERLLFTGMSGNYSTVVTRVVVANITVTFEFMECTDADTNHYPVVKVGSQVWMAKNLKTKHYMNGDSIPTTYPPDLNIVDSIAPKYQWAYNGDENNADIYGRMYTWYVIDDERGVCPSGWHVADSSEIMEMALYIFNQGNYLSKDLASTKYWKYCDTVNTVGNHPELNNRFGIGMVPSGSRHEDGPFLWLGYGGSWWSSTVKDENLAYVFGIMYNQDDYIDVFSHPKRMGDCIRCIKDEEE
jgi:uncharacterized protein (TIGR02145 family)